MTPTFQGEVLMRRWSDSSTQGVQVTFALSDASDLEPLKIKTGKRFMAVLVEIGDDEAPVDPPMKRDRGLIGDLCWRAIKWGEEEEFQQWIQVAFDKFMDGTGEGADLVPVGYTHEEWAKQCILTMCEATSRKDLDKDARCGALFNRLIRGPYQKHLQARGLV